MISRLFNGLISYVLFVLTFYIPVAEESLSSIESFKTQDAHEIRFLGLFAESTNPFSQIVRYKTEYPLLLQMHMGFKTRLHKTIVMC